MIRRHVLAALAAGVEAGDDDVARRRLASVDLVLRGASRRRFERAMIDAALASAAAPTEGQAALRTARPAADDVAHVQRVAALLVAGVPGAAANGRDPEAILAAYRALPVTRPSARPIATIAVAVGCIVLASAVALYVVFATTDVVEARAKPPRIRPAVIGAFATGGMPPGDAELEAVFVEELTAVVLETDRARQRGGLDPDRAQHAAALAASPVIAARGDRLATAWTAMLGMLDRWVSVPQSSREFRDIVREFRHRVRAVSDELAALGIGLYLEGDVLARTSGAHALIYSYKVTEVAFVQANGQPRRVLGLSRLDRINLEHALLGMQAEELGDPVLMMDQIERHVTTRVLPVLEPDAPYPLADPAYQEGTGRELALAVGRAVRTELVAALGTAAVTDRLARCRQIVAATVRRHEAQHGIDEDRARPLRYPSALERHLGNGVDEDGEPLRWITSARLELAAYLSQLINDPSTPQLTLWNLGRFAFTERLQGTAESYAAIVVLEGLARHLRIASPGPVIHSRRIDRERLAAIAAPLAELPGDAIRTAARYLWLELYAERHVDIVDAPPHAP